MDTIKYTILAIILVVSFSCSSKKGNVSSEKPQLLQKPNILLICVDDLRPELKSFGANYISSPFIDEFASTSVSFLNHFVNAPSCGPSRYTLLTGLYGPPSNNALFLRANKMNAPNEKVNPSMPEWFRSHGYSTVSVGKVSHHPGGRGGENWDNESIIEMPHAWDKHVMPVSKWQHPRGMMHGLANGEIRVKPSDMDVFQSVLGDDTTYPDGWITNEALNQLKELSADNEKPFFLAVGLLKPHLPFGAPKSYLDKYKDVVLPPIAHPEKPLGKTTWHDSGEFRAYNSWGKDPNKDKDFADEVRKHYAACVSYADAQIGKILAELKRSGAIKNTIVILWGDHGWHLGEHGIWGKHSLFEESLKSPLIISYPNMKKANSKTSAIVESLDIFPTLCDLAGIETPPFVKGISLKGILEHTDTEGHPALAYTNSAKTIRTKNYRLTIHKDDEVELYDLTSPEKETKNIAHNYPHVVDSLTNLINLKKLE